MNLNNRQLERLYKRIKKLQFTEINSTSVEISLRLDENDIIYCLILNLNNNNVECYKNDYTTFPATQTTISYNEWIKAYDRIK